MPILLISPWAKHHFIDHTQYEFGSFLKLAEVTFNLPSLGTRDVTSYDMMNSFDFNQRPQLTFIEATNFIGPTSSTRTTFPTEANENTSTAPLLLKVPVELLYLVAAAAVVAVAIIASITIRRHSLKLFGLGYDLRPQPHAFLGPIFSHQESTLEWCPSTKHCKFVCTIRI